MEARTQETTTPSPTKPSPLTIPPEEFVDTPSSSTTASPAESYASDAGKQPKPWVRSASVAGSVNSSKTTEPLWEEDINEAEENEEPEGSIVVANSATVSAQALRMQTHLRGMQRRLDGLQRAMQEAAQQGRLRLHSQDLAADTQSYSITAADGDAGESEELQRRATPAPKVRAEERGWLDSASPSEYVEDALNDEANDSRDDHHGSISSPPAIIELLNRIKTLQGQLKEAADENQQLQCTVHMLEEENARLQAQTAFNPAKDPGSDGGSTGSVCDQESSDARGDEASEGHGECISRLTAAIFGEASAFQMVMEEDLAVLKNHERCQHKLHELWDTIRTLRTFVETYELERNAMKIQRDEAIASAERADAENVKLASSSNPQQKIKYLQQVKKDNQALRRKNRALNARIAKQAAKVIREKNGCSLLEEVNGERSIDTTFDSTEECDESPAARTGEEILRSMRDRSGVLEQHLERLRLARHEGEDGSSSDEASGSESELRAAGTAAVLDPRPPATSAR
ncbi:hypothetical protein PHYPSEUDO_011009 [Phytophthora pseudosyringae]|uniref:Uncharacterized protein n=1 Tax=Phytophthora pseudosyringae TaxID=221518 RepID=A0A8T1V925_9STRA|nr:hypothetical protein PHYPSEUDO_011009 [Phytophthora pseudosyringae]